jgi:hypothetical protein
MTSDNSITYFWQYNISPSVSSLTLPCSRSLLHFELTVQSNQNSQDDPRQTLGSYRQLDWKDNQDANHARYYKY